MWSEEWDKKIQSAADNSEPVFQEKSWDQMEALLEKHLPAEEKRRRLFILFFTLLTTGALVFLILQQRPGRPNRTSTERTSQTSTPSSLTNTHKKNIPATGEGAVSFNNDPAATVDAATPDISAAPVTRHTAASTPGTSYTTAQQKSTLQKQVLTAGPLTEKSFKQTITTQEKPVSLPAEENNNNETTTAAPGNNTGISNSIAPATETREAVSATADSSTAEKNTTDSTTAVAETTKPDNKTGKPRQSFSKRLGITASLGVDVNGVRLNELNNAKTVWGVGLSYDVSRRITMRTGFFASRKIYVANPSDYHPPYNFWNYYPNLQKIDANCMVYEIPLSVIYNGGNTAKSHWFASAGFFFTDHEVGRIWLFL
ncbi:MAG: hypothetical protein QM781_21615 [Chitinophagaceae bacterium]